MKVEARAWPPPGCRFTFRVLKSGKVSFKISVILSNMTMEATGRAASVEGAERIADKWLQKLLATPTTGGSDASAH